MKNRFGVYTIWMELISQFGLSCFQFTEMTWVATFALQPSKLPNMLGVRRLHFYCLLDTDCCVGLRTKIPLLCASFLLYVHGKKDHSVFPESVSGKGGDICFTFQLKNKHCFCLWQLPAKGALLKRQVYVRCIATLCSDEGPFVSRPPPRLGPFGYCSRQTWAPGFPAGTPPPVDSHQRSRRGRTFSSHTPHSPPAAEVLWCQLSGCWQTHSWLLQSVFLLLKKIFIYKL